jgi:SAM-dependent methyltransferase
VTPAAHYNASVLTRINEAIFRRTHRFWPFLEANALAINEARMNHLASLHLPIEGKSVIEVGAGIGLLTGFFEERGCKVLSTDARPDLLAEIKRRHPARRVATLDLEHPDGIEALGKFDVAFCYGTLYHLGAPELALQALSQVSDLILLETSLSRGEDEAAPLVEESTTMNQAYSLQGSRPTRAWVMSRLRKFWGHGYISVTQPSHPDFPLDWTVPSARLNTRAIFVGSRTPISNPLLTEEIPDRHRTV